MFSSHQQGTWCVTVTKSNNNNTLVLQPVSNCTIVSLCFLKTEPETVSKHSGDRMETLSLTVNSAQSHHFQLDFRNSSKQDVLLQQLLVVLHTFGTVFNERCHFDISKHPPLSAFAPFFTAHIWHVIAGLINNITDNFITFWWGSSRAPVLFVVHWHLTQTSSVVLVTPAIYLCHFRENT